MQTLAFRFSAFLTVLGLALSGQANADNAPTQTSSVPGLVWTPDDGDVIRFDVRRQGKPFGTHEVRFDVLPDGTVEAHTDVKLRAGFGPIPLYRYDLKATERWQDGRLMELEGEVYKHCVSRRGPRNHHPGQPLEYRRHGAEYPAVV